MNNLIQYIECINCNESYIYNEPSHDRLDYCDECRLEIIAAFDISYPKTTKAILSMLTGANRPHITGIGREFFANVTMEDGKIVGVK
tara:strand:+ start:291 stop:551 length:261 start_codon:yes stop_codon:yes gene_type:complete